MEGLSFGRKADLPAVPDLQVYIINNICGTKWQHGVATHKGKFIIGTYLQPAA